MIFILVMDLNHLMSFQERDGSMKEVSAFETPSIRVRVRVRVRARVGDKVFDTPSDLF